MFGRKRRKTIRGMQGIIDAHTTSENVNVLKVKCDVAGCEEPSTGLLWTPDPVKDASTVQRACDKHRNM